MCLQFGGSACSSQFQSSTDPLVPVYCVSMDFSKLYTNNIDSTEASEARDFTEMEQVGSWGLEQQKALGQGQKQGLGQAQGLVHHLLQAQHRFDSKHDK